MVDDMSQNLEARSLDGAQNSWAYVVTDLTQSEVQRELDALNRDLAEPSKLFVSASNHCSVTVSGPPSRLKLAFRESDILRYSKFAALPVFSGLCHAPHIYTREHASRVLDAPSIQNLGQTHTHFIPLHSTESGKPFEMVSSYQLLEDIILEILTRSIHVNHITSAVVDQLKVSNTDKNMSVLGFAATKHPFVDLISRLEANHITISNSNMLSWINIEQVGNSGLRNPSESPIAIVGMACRYPGGANDLDSFWELLEKGRDVHTKIPADRFDVDSHYDPTGKRINSTLTPYGCFVDEPGLFDASFFNMSARESLETDPMHRLALVTAYEALERAGYVPNRTPASDVKRVGVFYGQASDDYREVNTAQDIGTYFIPGGCRAFAPGRISYFFGFWGPSFSCDTACSSSLATVQQACTSLWAGDADTIVAGGLNILTNPDAFAGLGRGHFLSSTGNCKTWDSTADGYCRADGVGSIVLKRLEDAEADNDNILGLIPAAATNHSGDAVSITHPHAAAQTELFTKVANRAGIDPLDVNYVEFHGTGTQAGDSTEIESVLNVFAPSKYIPPLETIRNMLANDFPATRKRRPEQPLYIGAVKSNIGHGEAAAGVTALIKVLCMLQNDAIPPHIGIKNVINPVLPRDLVEKRNVHIPFEKTSWSQQSHGRKRLAVINNFSAAGGNTTILLEEAPKRPKSPTKDTRQHYVIAVSAKSRPSLTGNINSLISYLDSHPEVSLADLSYTTCKLRTCKSSFEHIMSWIKVVLLVFYLSNLGCRYSTNTSSSPSSDIRIKPRRATTAAHKKPWVGYKPQSHHRSGTSTCGFRICRSRKHVYRGREEALSEPSRVCIRDPKI
jgi:3-oxoacyl-(acyl-carrier-protein) synthase